MADVEALASSCAFLAGGGETGKLIRAYDWTATPLGPPERWPSSLKTAVSLLLTSAGPVHVAWGPQLTSFYNDSYLPIVGTKHPGIGLPFADLWAEIWDEFRPIIETTMAGNAQRFVDMPVALAGRPGLPLSYFTFSYTTLRDDDGRPAGFYCAAIETTDKVLAERRRNYFGLESRLREATTAQAALDAACEALGRQLGAVVVTFNELDANREHLEVTSEWRAGDTPSTLGRHRLADWGEKWVAGMLSGKVEQVEDITTDPRAAGTAAEAAYAAVACRASLNVPLMRDGGVRAMLAVGDAGPRRWTAEDIALVEETIERAWQAAERARAEAALRESETRYRSLFENIDAGFCIVEMLFDENERPIDYRFVEVNPAFEAQTGLVSAEGKRMRELAPAHENHWFEIYGQIALTGEPMRFENEAAALGRWYDVHAFRVGEPLQHRVAILFNDITQRRSAEADLRELNEMLEQRVADALAERKLFAHVVETSNAAMLVLDLDYTILAINGANMNSFERVYGQRPKAGDNLLELLMDMPEHQAQVRDTWSRALRGEEFVAIDTFGDETRERVAFEIRFASLRDRTGKLIGASQTAYDISDRVRAQAELEAAQEALRQSQKMEAMGQLTGGVAHDFNNLLTPIVGSLDMLQRKGLGNEREQRLIAGAMQSAERAKTLVQRLLAFARRQPLQAVAVDISKLVTGMGDLMASTTGPQIRVVVEVAADLPAANADPNQLEMAILNLAVNARDAMPTGGTLRISARVASVELGHRSQLSTGEYILLSVADTGTGMDEVTIARAIEPFFSTKGVGKGTGLGLSMVHGLASQLGGALTIQSRPGLGTNVELWLPKSTAAPGALESIQELTAATRTSGTALLVDDEELVRMSTADMLTDLGYAVIEASSGEEAMRLINKGERFDLLVTDHLMPGMNGTDLVLAIRSVAPEIPVLLVSGYAENEGVDPDLPRLTKPFRKDELATSLAQLSTLNT